MPGSTPPSGSGESPAITGPTMMRLRQRSSRRWRSAGRLISLPSTVSPRSGRPRRRPWHVGILWEGDRRLPAAVIAEVGSDPALVVGDNEPYAGGLPGDTMDTHAIKRGLRHALIEIRQDLVAVDSDAVEWGERLAHILPKAVARAGSDL